jgi:hypothetical protein
VHFLTSSLISGAQWLRTALSRFLLYLKTAADTTSETSCFFKTSNYGQKQDCQWVTYHHYSPTELKQPRCLGYQPLQTLGTGRSVCTWLPSHVINGDGTLQTKAGIFQIWNIFLVSLGTNSEVHVLVVHALERFNHIRIWFNAVNPKKQLRALIDFLVTQQRTKSQLHPSKQGSPAVKPRCTPLPSSKHGEFF